MKNQIVIHLVSNKTWGGGESYVLDLVQELRSHNENVLIICKTLTVAQRFIEKGFSVKMLPLRGFTDIVSPIILLKIIRAYDSVILHSHNFKDAFTATIVKTLCPKVKSIVTRHLVKPSKNGWPYRFIYRNSNHIIFVSQLAQEKFNSKKNSLLKEKQTVILNSIPNQTELSSKNIPKGLIQNVPIIMYHGRLAREKGVDILIRAVSKINTPFHVAIIGTGEDAYVRQLKQLVQSLNLTQKIDFLGYREDASLLTKYASFGVLPSVVAEACGLSNMEYMRSGKAQITTNIGAQKEYITNGETGILVAPNNTDTLTDAINQLLQNSILCNNMGVAAKEYFEKNLSYSIFFTKIYNLYSKKK